MNYQICIGCGHLVAPGEVAKPCCAQGSFLPIHERIVHRLQEDKKRSKELRAKLGQFKKAYELADSTARGIAFHLGLVDANNAKSAILELDRIAGAVS